MITSPRVGPRILAVAFLLAACAESNPPAVNSAGGTLVILTGADPKNLFPPLITSMPGRQVAEQIYDYLAVVGPELNTYGDAGFLPRLAESWKWSADSLSIAFMISPRARWHDGVSADASDVRYTFLVYRNPKVASPSAEEIANIDSVTTSGSRTAVFWYHVRSSHQLLDATQLMIIPRHVFEKVSMDSLSEIGASAAPIGTGRFRFKDWTRGSTLELVADTANYRGAPGLSRLIWSVTPDAATALTRLWGGEADVYAAMTAETVSELRLHPAVRAVSLPGTDYAFMVFNLRRSLFASRELRRALTMAIDRALLTRNVFDTLAKPAIGPTVRAFPTTDTAALKQLPFDPGRAKAILDSLGWKVGPNGVRMRGRQELAFSAVVPSSSQPRVRMAVLIQEQLRRVGVRMSIDQMEFNTLQSRLDSHDFDAAYWNWHLGATPNSLRETWGGRFGHQNGSINYGGYDSPGFDASVDSAISSSSLAVARAHFTSAYRIIIDDAPAVWLYEPQTVIGLNRRIRTSAMRADAWWFDLAGWFIPKLEQIPRDRVSSGR